MKKKMEGRRAHERPPRATGDGGRGKRKRSRKRNTRRKEEKHWGKGTGWEEEKKVGRE